MSKCLQCGRTLEKEETDLCPACKSTKDHETKRWVEIAGGVLTVVVGIAIAVFTGGKGGGGGGV